MNPDPFSRNELYGKEARDASTSARSLGSSVRSRVVAYILLVWRYVLRSLKKLWAWLRSSSSPKELCTRIGIIIAAIGGFFFGILLLWMLWVFITLPDVDDIGALFAAESTVITDRNGIELYRIHADEDRTFVPLSDMSDAVKQATIAIEDQRFYDRGCLDIRAIIRVILGAGQRGGGSTITRQLARNALGLKKESLVSRKLKELVLGCQLEHRYDKDRILELYLNRIPYGHNAHGAEQASRIYFAKSASGLTIAEASILAALPQRPTYFSPYRNQRYTSLSEAGEERMRAGKIDSPRDIRDEDFWIGLIGREFVLEESTGVIKEVASGTGAGIYIGGRTDQVLKNMEDQDFITTEERSQALSELQTIEFTRARENIRAPHFVLWIRDLIEEQFADRFEEGFLEQGGLTITASLDWELQQRAEAIVTEIGDHNRDFYEAHNAALLAVDPNTGEILTYVGNRDYWDEETDGNVDIIRAPRQPGSSFKPFSYAAAFLNDYSPATVLYDVPTKIGDDEPENFDSGYFGPMTIRSALGASRNIPAAKSFFLSGGEEAIVSLVEQMGIPTVRNRKEEISDATGELYEYGWPLSIGAAEVPLFEMVQGYSTFARGGAYIDPVAVLRIEDRHGNILYQSPEEPEATDVLDPRAAYMITSILSDKSARPAGYWRDQLSLPGYQNAAKTGTSNKCLKRDDAGKCIDSKPDNTWTIGYTPNLVVGAWAGNGSGGALSVRASGLDTASHMWKRFMSTAHASLDDPVYEFDAPDRIVSAQISELSGKLASSCTPEEKRRADIFFEGQAPTEFDDACAVVEVDKLTNLLASEECPPEAREQGSFFVPRSALPERWPDWERGVQQWAQAVEAGTGSLFYREVYDEKANVTRRVFRGTGAFLPLPLPLIPERACTKDDAPGRDVRPIVDILFPNISNPAPGRVFRPRVNFTVGDKVREIRFEIDGLVRGIGTEENNFSPEVRLPRRFDINGVHRLRVTLTDSYYNVATDQTSFVFGEGGSTRIPVESPTERVRIRR